MCIYEHIQEEAFQANRQLSDQGMVIFNFGNASAVDRKLGVFAIKPNVGPYENYYPSDMVILDFEAKVVKGKDLPSSDAPTHAVLYKHWEKIGGIVRTQSPYASAWAQAGRMVPIQGSFEVDPDIMAIPCTSAFDEEEVVFDFQERVGDQIINHFKKSGLSFTELEMVLVGSYFPFTWGINVEKAVNNSVILEDLARKTLFSLLKNSTNLNSNYLNDCARRVNTELILFRVKQQAKLIYPL